MIADHRLSDSCKRLETLSKRCFLKNVIKPIIDNSIHALEVQEGDLTNVHEPKLEKLKRKQKCNIVAVQKLKPLKSVKMKTDVIVSVPAPPDASLKQRTFKQVKDSKDLNMEVNMDGKIMLQDTLGRERDFIKQIDNNGANKDRLKETGGRDEMNDGWMENECKLMTTRNKKLLYESKSLKHWRVRMGGRICQQNHLSCMLNKPVEHLAMNQGDLIRRANEIRGIIDVTASFIECGKGNRIGSEFWNEPTLISGDEECGGLHSTMTHAQKGYVATMSFVDIPDFIHCCEKGLDKNLFLTSISRPWLKSFYLRERLNKFDSLFRQLNPHIPQTCHLVVYGCNHETLERRQPQLQPEQMINHMSQWDFSCAIQNFSTSSIHHQAPPGQSPGVQSPLSSLLPISNARIKTDRTVENFVNSSSLVFGDNRVAWQDQPCSTLTSRDVEVRVLFEEVIGCRAHSIFDITNNGVTVIFYGWKKLVECQSFESQRSATQKFYFNPTQGVVLPGETRSFACTFKSCDHGIYEEKWQFLTQPIIGGGGRMILTLKGIALKPDHNKINRDKMIGELMRRASFQVAGDIVEGIVNSIKETERPSSPPPPLFEEDVFLASNSGKFIYIREKCQELQEIYKEAMTMLESQENIVVTDGDDCRDILKANEPWNLDVDLLKETIMQISEAEDSKEDLLGRFNSILINISSRNPLKCLMREPSYHAVYLHLCETIEEIDKLFVREEEILNVSKEKSNVNNEQINDCEWQDTFYAQIKSRERLYTMAYNAVCNFIEEMVLIRSGLKRPCKDESLLPVTNEPNSFQHLNLLIRK